MIFFFLPAPRLAVYDEMHKGLAEREREKSLRITQRPSDSNYTVEGAGGDLGIIFKAFFKVDCTKTKMLWSEQEHVSPELILYRRFSIHNYTKTCGLMCWFQGKH